jgi:hypothetical protein
VSQAATGPAYGRKGATVLLEQVAAVKAKMHDVQISQDQGWYIGSMSIAIPTELTFFSLRYN